MPLVDGILEADRGSDKKSLPGTSRRLSASLLGLAASLVDTGEKAGKACVWRLVIGCSEGFLLNCHMGELD